MCVCVCVCTHNFGTERWNAKERQNATQERHKRNATQERQNGTHERHNGTPCILAWHSGTPSIPGKPDVNRCLLMCADVTDVFISVYCCVLTCIVCVLMFVNIDLYMYTHVL